MALPTIAQNAPYTWIILADANGNAISSLPIGAPGGITAGSDAQTAANVPENQAGIFNGATVDRWRSVPSGNGVQTQTGTARIGQLLQDPFNAGNYTQASSGTGDAVPAITVPAVGMMVSNGTTWDRVSTTKPVPVQDVGSGAVTIVQQSASIVAGAAGTCTLAATGGKTTYIVGFTITSAAVAAVVNGTVTITGLANTFSLTYDNLVTGQSYLSQYYGERGIPASAVNTTIVVNFPAITGGGATTINAWGYQL